MASYFISCNITGNNRKQEYRELLERIPEEQHYVVGIFSRISIGILYHEAKEMRCPQLTRRSPQCCRSCSTQHLPFPGVTFLPTQIHPPHHTGPGLISCHTQDHCQNIKHYSTPATCPACKSHTACDPGPCTSSSSFMVTTKDVHNV